MAPYLHVDVYPLRVANSQLHISVTVGPTFARGGKKLRKASPNSIR